jgi:hypothetical protein
MEPRSVIFCQSTLVQVAKTALATAMMAALVACGDPKYQPPAIVVTFFSPPPTALNTGSTTGLTAVVANDPGSGNVIWTCTPINACGTFNPTTIHTNVPTCYQAPGNVPPTNPVTVTATSVGDSTKSASATITISSGAPDVTCAP